MLGRILYLSFIIASPLVFHGITAQNDFVEILAETKECYGDIDLVIVVDGSYSVKAANFLYIKEWIKDVAHAFDISKGSVQIGVVQYSYWYSNRPMWRQRYINTEIKLGEYADEESFNKAVNRIRYQGFRTFTAHALNKTIDYDFHSRKSRYPEAQRAIILLTDGKATDAADLPGAVKHAKEAGVVIFTVGVGDYSINELLTITNGNRERIFELQNFQQLANIVYELPFTLKRACDCDPDGSLSNECDPCTRQCVCKPNVEGRRCDKCAAGHFDINHPDGCRVCGCNPLGTVDENMCDSMSGQCRCHLYSSIIGRTCDRCEDEMHGFPECTKCQCNGFSTKCSVDSGVCLNCSRNRGGAHCDTCKNGYYFNQLDICVPCQCNGHAAMNGTEICDVSSGECLHCLHGTTGPHCERCDAYHIREPLTGRCIECSCNTNGTEPSKCENGLCSCDPITGQCPCMANVVGVTCNACADGFWNEELSKGCKACGCHGQGSTSQVCDKSTGQCKCLTGHKGIKCEECDRGYLRWIMGDVCSSCDCNLSGSLPESCVNGICSCDNITGQCPCRSNIEGLSCDMCLDGFWGFGAEEGCQACKCHKLGSLSTSCDEATGECECLPGHSGQKCENCDRGYYRDNPDDECKECECITNGTEPSKCENGLCTCDPITGECPCMDNVIGATCDACADGFWNLGGGRRGCEACGCHGQGSASQVCDKETGKCECLPGHTGNKCDECAHGHLKQNQDEFCKSCNCDPSGTLSSSCINGSCSCDPVTGQCSCRPNIEGLSCDNCLDGFWGFDSEEGCQACECHQLGSLSTACDKNTGVCECLPGHSGEKCENCEEGYFHPNPEDSCTECECNKNGTDSSKCENILCTCDPVTGQCPCMDNVIGTTCDACADGFWNLGGGRRGCEVCGCHGQGSASQVCDKETGKCECLPGHRGNKCDECAHGHLKQNQDEFCTSCNCDPSGTLSSSCINGSCSCDSVTGQCPCRSNIGGLSCDNCLDGFWGFDAEEGCQACKCHKLGSLSTSCDKNTGVCECLPGYSGENCRVCEEGYFHPNPEDSCTECECNTNGTESSKCENGLCTCDPVTGQCPCMANVISVTCGACADGFWDLGGGKGCRACGCHGQGSVSQVCDKVTGRCECLPGHTGDKCEKCERGYLKENGEDACTSCDCNMSGSLSSSCITGVCSCDPVTGQCPCRSNIEGLACDNCLDGFWGFGAEEGCQACKCHKLGSLSTSCDENNGKCECLPGHTDQNCEICAKGYFRGDPEGACRECNCNTTGTEPSKCEKGHCTCDTVTGQCPCLDNVIGVTCDACADGFWDLEVGKGCEACGCHGQGSVSQVCNKVTGECECLPGQIGNKCEECQHGHLKKNQEDTCTSCGCNPSGTLSSSCINGICSCDPVTGQCPCRSNIEGLSCDSCLDGFWGFGAEGGCQACKCHKLGSLSTSCDENTGECECLPGHAGPNCENCDHGYFRPNPREECRACDCNTLGTNSTSCQDGICSCDPVTGQCLCLPNVVGLLCDKCDDEYWNLGNPEGCELCTCENVGCISPVCNKNTGVCDCKPGHIGSKCENCTVGYFRSSPEVVCQACSCNMYGRLPSSCDGDVCSCDLVTGQCPCLPNVTGMSCDRCLDGFWDLGSMRGCKSCRCHKNGSSSQMCEGKTGKCECNPSHKGWKCEDCENGYWKQRFEDKCQVDVLNDEPVPSPTTTVAVTTSTSIKTRPTPSTTTTTTTRRRTTPWPTNRTFKPPIMLSTRRPPMTKPTRSRSGCNVCIPWPSYCHGWMCRQRWPHHTFQPAPKRCNYGHLSCQYSVESMYDQYGGYKNKVSTTKAPQKKPKFGYRAYASNSYNYIVPYYSRRRTHHSSSSRSTRTHQPISFGLYRSLYGKKN